MRLSVCLTLACSVLLVALFGRTLLPPMFQQRRTVTHAGLTLPRPSAKACASFATDDLMLFSSRASPSGKWVAENYGSVCNGSSNNFIAIRRSGDERLPSDKLTSTGAPDVSIFFAWADDGHLAVREGSSRSIVNEPILSGPAEFKGIEVTYSRYEVKGISGEVDMAQNVTGLDVPAKGVAASFDERRSYTGKICELSIELSDGAIYDTVGIDIDVTVNPCNGMLCGGVSSQFWLGNRIDGRYGKPLTSATVSFIPSYNWHPVSVGHRAVQGVFYNKAGTSLVKQLDAERISVQYFLNFTETLTSYSFSTEQIRSVLSKFSSCAGEVDLEWLNHSNNPL